MASRGFWARLRDGIGNLLGAGRQARSAADQPSVSPPQSVPYPYEEYDQPTQPMPVPDITIFAPPEPKEPLDVRYIPKHKASDGKHTVLERWKIGDRTTHLDMDDVREIFRRVGYRDYYTFLITGYPKNPYPGKEGQDQITLSYRMNGGRVLDYIEDHMGDDNEVDWFSDLTRGGYTYGGEWSEISSIDVVDR